MRVQTTLAALLVLTLPAAHAACDPGGFVPAGTRTYAMTAAGHTTTMTTAATVKNDTVTVQTTVDGRTRITVWTCGARGMTANLGAGTGAVQVDAWTLPSTKAWRVGTSWDSVSRVTLGSGMTMTGTAHSRIAAQEKLTTPAGTFTAFRVDTTTTTRMSPPAGKTLPAGMAAMNRASKTVTWYARGIGMVKLIGADGQSTVTLTRLSR